MFRPQIEIPVSNRTKIQWCDSTVNPVMGCDGCPLYPSTTAEVAGRVSKRLKDELGLEAENARQLLKLGFADQPFSAVYQFRESIGASVSSALRIQGHDAPKAAEIITEEIASSLRCYAGLLHLRWGEQPSTPGKAVNSGYPLRFENVTEFPGRMADAAKWCDLTGQAREDSPWRDGLPRLIFVSDMGDALSAGVSFEFLKREIIDVVNSQKGKAHIWLWLTKRPRRMADFSDWLAEQGVEWPDNLVPMTSVLNQDMAVHVKHLKRIPAKVRGLSVEPLWESVELDLDGIDWVIVGGESGGHAKVFDLAWVRDLRDHCVAEGKAFFMKQLGANPWQDGERVVLKDPHGGDWGEWPEDLRVREFPALFGQAAGNGDAGPAAGEVVVISQAAESGDLPLFVELHKIVVRGFAAFLEAGEALAEIRRMELWKTANYKSWGAYCESLVGLSKQQVNRLICAAHVWRSIVDEVEPIGSGSHIVTPRSESQLRPLGGLKDPAQQRAAWVKAATAAGGQPTAKQVTNAVLEIVGLPPAAKKAAKPTCESLRLVIVKAIELARGHAAHDEIESRLREVLALTEEVPDLHLAKAG